MAWGDMNSILSQFVKFTKDNTKQLPVNISVIQLFNASKEESIIFQYL